MGEIYKQSQRVIVWLGRDDQHSDTAMRLIADISLIQGQIHIEDYPDSYMLFLNASFKKYQEYLPRLLTDRLSIESFLRLPYWSRLWIVQEFVLAQDLLLVYGPHAVMSTALTTLISTSGLPRWFGKPTVITIPPESVRSLSRARHERETGVMFSLPEIQMIGLLREFSARKCDNPRDRVYGLLGLCDGKVEINIDYNKSSDEVFRELFTTLSYFKGYDELWFLQLPEDMGVMWRHPKPRWSTNFNE